MILPVLTFDHLRYGAGLRYNKANTFSTMPVSPNPGATKSGKARKGSPARTTCFHPVRGDMLVERALPDPLEPRRGGMFERRRGREIMGFGIFELIPPVAIHIAPAPVPP